MSGDRAVPGRSVPGRTFPVWAPHAATVDLHLTGRDPLPLTRGDDGWWQLPEPLDASPDPLDYAFAVDGADPHPDPRSRRQPDGVHAPGREFDPGAYAWGCLLYTSDAADEL